jgi:hypothetical protein
MSRPTVHRRWLTVSFWSDVTGSRGPGRGPGRTASWRPAQPIQGQTPAARFDRQIQKNRVKSIVSRLLRLISEVFGIDEFHADFGSIPAKKEEEGDSDD